MQARTEEDGIARHHGPGRLVTRPAHRWWTVAVAVLIVAAGCGTGQENLRLPDGRPAGAVAGGIVLEGRVPPGALSDRYRVIVIRGQKLVRSEGLGAHDTYGWLLPPGRYTVELIGKLVPRPLVQHVLVRLGTTTRVNFEIHWH